MKKLFFLTGDLVNKFLDIFFLLGGISLLLMFRDMKWLHIISIVLMLLMLMKCYRQGIGNGMIWLALVIIPLVVLMSMDGEFGIGDFSEAMLILIPSMTAGLLAERQRRYVQQLKETYLSTLKAFAEVIDSRDNYTQGHSERVAQYAVAIAKELSLSEEEIDILEKAALLHDIGKIAVPDRVLYKAESLSDDEWEIMKRHPEHGRRILSRLDFLSPVLPAILYHHQRVDHKGYPEMDAETTLPLGARILAVADTFDAMTTDRPYRKGLSPQEALTEIEKGLGSQFDPAVVMAFEDVIKRKERKDDQSIKVRPQS